MFTTQRVFIHHAVSLHQTFVHCGRFSTAATRRCMVRHSVFPDHSGYQTIPSSSTKLVNLERSQHVSLYIGLLTGTNSLASIYKIVREVVTGSNDKNFLFPPVFEFRDRISSIFLRIEE